MKPYAIISDIHLHNWSAFKGAPVDGKNSRLAGLLNELVRCNEELHKAGGNVMYGAGDMFHVRGSVAPSVLNPALETFEAIVKSGTEVRVIAGNHDLEGKESERLGSAITALETVGVKVIHQPTSFRSNKVVMVPWVEDLTMLRSILEKLGERCAGFDAILHAPINGVIKGIPDTGLDPTWLSKLGLGRIFAGHYHNHVDFGNGVYSIGALAHHTWSDVGARAGFMIVHEDRVEHFDSALPKFVEIDGDMDADHVARVVKGNYVKARTKSSKVSELKALREWLEGLGAAGVNIIPVKEATVTREGGVVATVSAGASIEVSVSAFIKSKSYERPADVEREALNVLAEAA